MYKLDSLLGVSQHSGEIMTILETLRLSFLVWYVGEGSIAVSCLEPSLIYLVVCEPLPSVPSDPKGLYRTVVIVTV